MKARKPRAAPVPSDSPVMEQKFLSVAEVAKVARVSKMTIYRMCNSGELDCIRIGRVFRIPEAAAQKFLSGRRG